MKGAIMPTKFKKDLTTKALNQGWHYYKIFKNDYIVAVRLSLSDIGQVVEKGGEPVIENKMPFFEWKQSIESKILTKKQYDELVESGFDEDIN